MKKSKSELSAADFIVRKEREIAVKASRGDSEFCDLVDGVMTSKEVTGQNSEGTINPFSPGMTPEGFYDDVHTFLSENNVNDFRKLTGLPLLTDEQKAGMRLWPFRMFYYVKPKTSSSITTFAVYVGLLHTVQLFTLTFQRRSPWFFGASYKLMARSAHHFDGLNELARHLLKYYGNL